MKILKLKLEIFNHLNQDLLDSVGNESGRQIPGSDLDLDRAIGDAVQNVDERRRDAGVVNNEVHDAEHAMHQNVLKDESAGVGPRRLRPDAGRHRDLRRLGFRIVRFHVGVGLLL